MIRPFFPDSGSSIATFSADTAFIMNGREAVEFARKQVGFEGLMLDPDGRFLPLPLFYLSDVIEIVDNYEGEEK